MANYDNLIEKFQNKNFDEQLNFLFQIKQFFEENDKKFFEKMKTLKMWLEFLLGKNKSKKFLIY